MFDRAATSPSKTLLVCALSFCLGIAFHAFGERQWGGGELLSAAAAAGASFAFFRRRPDARLLCAALALCALGSWRFDAALAALPRTQDPPPGRQLFRGVLRDEPRLRVSDTVYVMDRVAFFERGKWRQLDLPPETGGKRAKGGAAMEVRGGPAGDARYGDEVEWRCVAAPAMRAMFVLRHIAWRCTVWDPPSVVGPGEAGWTKRALVAARTATRSVAGRLLPEPESSLLLGLLIGDVDGMPADLREAFRRTGTSHILAVSGYNVTRLVEIVLILTTLAVARRKRAAALTALAVLGFVLLAGAEASVARAGIMGGVSLLARLLGRRYSGTVALICAAAAMLAAEPFALRYDVGFQLSFVAVWGLHALGPAFVRHARFMPEILGLRSIFGETMAATLATLPISLAVFGTLPLASPLVNLLVLPLIPAIMGIGAAALAAGALHTYLGLPPAFVDTLMLRAIESVVRSFAALPLVIDARISWIAAVLLYGWILLLWYALNHARPTPVLLSRSKRDEFIVEVVNHGS